MISKGMLIKFSKDNVTLILVILTILTALGIAIYQVVKEGKIDSLGFSTMGGLAFGTRVFQHGIENYYNRNNNNNSTDNNLQDAGQIHE